MYDELPAPFRCTREAVQGTAPSITRMFSIGHRYAGLRTGSPAVSHDHSPTRRHADPGTSHRGVRLREGAKSVFFPFVDVKDAVETGDLEQVANPLPEAAKLNPAAVVRHRYIATDEFPDA